MEQLLLINLRNHLNNQPITQSNIVSSINVLLNIIKTKKFYGTNENVINILSNVFNNYILNKYKNISSNIDNLFDSSPINDSYIKISNSDKNILELLDNIIPDIVDILYKPRKKCSCKLIF
tara:strand:+ start:121 stop:483 length:363 start_codon:yes stop_codon:yes gene_type:complete